MKPLLSLSFALLALTGCRPESSGYVPVPEGKVEPASTKVAGSEELMPLDVGNQWTYSLQAQASKGNTPQGSDEGTVSYRVASRSGSTALLLLEQDGKIIEQQDWEATPQGLFQRSGSQSRILYTPPQPMALLPLDADRTFTWSGTGPMGGSTRASGSMTANIRRPEDVDTAMGTLSAIPVYTHTTYAKGSMDNVSWYRPGIGLVRVRQTTKDKATGRTEVILLTLTNYAVKRKTSTP